MRVLSGEAWARAHSGDVKPAIELLGQARGLVEGPQFSDLDRGEILFRLGVCRYLLSSIATAVALFGEALALVERSPLPSDLLRSNIFTWRSRCYRRQRDYEAAREDVERALELAEALQDTRALGEAYFQASLIAERDGHWVLARTYAERAKSAVRGAHRPHERRPAAEQPRRSSSSCSASPTRRSRASRRRSRSRSRSATTTRRRRRSRRSRRRTSAPATRSRRRSTRATRCGCSATREDRLDEIGNARLVLGRALLEQGRLEEAEATLAEAEDAFAQLSSGSHRAAAWVAQGDLAQRRGDDRGAATLYRRAAETLQDFRF